SLASANHVPSSHACKLPLLSLRPGFPPQIAHSVGRRAIRINPDTPLARRVLAVELKLYRVRGALHQAFLRTAFADEILVGLPEDEARKVSNSALAYDFKSRGVGLLAVSNSQCNVLIAPAAAGARDSVLRALCVERFWNRSSKALDS
ncbi:MAG: hypothetical protein ACT4O1_15445, partial [Gemmatimonadota bacterium]